MRLTARAKINLLLRVAGRRPDSYHDLEMFNMNISPADEVLIEPAASLEVVMDPPIVPSDPSNLAFKAAMLLAARVGKEPSFRITVRKRIPVGAGLAGGSADAAAVLRGLSSLKGWEISEGDILELGLRLGADLPFSLTGGAAIVRGIGERITPVRTGRRIDLVVANPGFPVSTKEIFESLPMDSIHERDPSEAARMARAVMEGAPDKIAGSLGNDLEPIVAANHHEVGILKKRLIALGCLGAVMTGSGPTVIGIAPDHGTADRIAEKLGGESIFVLAASGPEPGPELLSGSD